MIASLSLAVRVVGLFRAGHRDAALALLSPSDEVAQELSHIAVSQDDAPDASPAGDTQ